MGNRLTDPYSEKLEPICESSPGWPQFTRVFPILKWTYHEVWAFLTKYNLEYCSLYDDGFTSLGEVHNSIRNPYLKNGNENSTGGSEEPEYLPAFCLQIPEHERFSRK